MTFGRRKILSDETAVTSKNVISIVSAALETHLENSSEIDWLYNYYKGRQPILDRQKTVRPEICNKVVENRANEIVSFKAGYLCGEPIQYISRGSTEKTTADVGKLNDFMVLCEKETLDAQLVEWMYICGTGYRMVLPNRSNIIGQIIPTLLNRGTEFSEDEAPFRLFTLDPRFCFVVYHSGLGEPPLCAVKYIVRQDGAVVFSVYSADRYFEFEAASLAGGSLNGSTPKETKRVLGYVPIIEYPLNNSRQGAFEIVTDILDAINKVQSNRLDGIEQFVQSLIVLYNAEISDENAKSLRETGLIKLKNFGENKADIKEIAQQLDQQQTQTLIDYMYQSVLDIVGMPNRNGGSSTSDTGQAVVYRDGWSTAETRAKQDEAMFKLSEHMLLRIVLRIMRDTVGTSLKLSDVDVKFTRRNYENIQSKAQVLVSMLNCEKVHPQLAFSHCGMFSDPESAYLLSKTYYDKLSEGWEPEIVDERSVINAEDDDDV